MNSLTKSVLIAIGGMVTGTGIIGRTVWIAEKGTKEVLPPAAERVVDESTGTLPELFQSFDFNQNGKIDVPDEALEFYVDKVTGSQQTHITSSISKQELQEISTWFQVVSRLEDTSDDERKTCLDVAARLSEYTKNKKEIQRPISGKLVDSDVNPKDNKLSLDESIDYYEKSKNTKLQRDANGQISAIDLGAIIDFFRSESTESAGKYAFYDVYWSTKSLEKSYEERFGIKYPSFGEVIKR